MPKRLLAAVLSMITCVTFAEGVARIKMDDEHLQMQRADGKTSSIYSFPPSKVLELESSSYKLVIADALKGKQANSIQLVLGKSEKFSAIWQNEKPIQLLSENTLKPNPGSTAFQGFRKGQEGVIAVGYMEGNSFSVFWVGMFKVQ